MWTRPIAIRTFSLHPGEKCGTLICMKSSIQRVRLQPHETEMLALICESGDRGKLNPSEMIRLLIHREWTRRTTGKSAIQTNAVASDFRTGRPKAVKARSTAEVYAAKYLPQ